MTIRSTIFAALLLSTGFAFPQITVKHLTEIKYPLKMDVSKPLRDIQEVKTSSSEESEDNVVPNQYYLPPHQTNLRPVDGRDQSLQIIQGINSFGDTILTIEGVSNRNGVYPPDVSGDVGPNNYVEMVNLSFQIWNKSGATVLGPSNLSTIWSGFAGAWTGHDGGDPVVLYDELADRWFTSQFSLPNYPNGPFYQLIAVSTTSDPTGSWNRYAYSFPDMNDYPKFGIWPDGYYMSANVFSAGSVTFAGTNVSVMDRAAMLAGNTATIQTFSFTDPNTAPYSFLPSDCDGTAPPAGSPNYFIWLSNALWWGGVDHLEFYNFHVDWTTPSNSTFSGPLSLPVTPFTIIATNTITQPVTTMKLDVLGERLMHRLQYRNFGTYESMVVCHTVDAGSGVAGIRWYQFNKTSGSWAINQQSTYAPNDGLNRWMGSIAQDSWGNIALGYSVGNSTLYPSIRFTGRYVSDSLNKMTMAEKSIKTGTGYQSGSAHRWGDYTTMSIDPDGQTFWYANEYIQTSGSASWKTKIASFQFGAPLPVELTSFNASTFDNTVHLFWRTETEQNNSGFEIERRFKTITPDDNTGWTKIGFTKGIGTSNAPRNYSYTDKLTGRSSIMEYRIKQIDVNGKYKYSTSVEVSVLPSRFELSQNYPNPFNPSTTIRYSLPLNSNIKITIYNPIGEEVKELFNGTRDAGMYELNFDAKDQSSGVYFCNMTVSSIDGRTNFRDTRKMVLIK